MSAQPTAIEAPTFAQVRERMIRELETFPSATVNRTPGKRWIPRVRGSRAAARYDGNKHVGQVEK